MTPGLARRQSPRCQEQRQAQGECLRAGRLLEHLLLGYGVQAVHHGVTAEQKLRQVLRIRYHFTRVYLHVRGHAKQAISAGKDLGPAQGLLCAEALAIEMALLEDVGIAQAKGPMPRRARRTAT